MIPRYTLPEMKKIWSDEAKLSNWLRIEIAAAKAMEQYKIIPEGVFNVINHIEADPDDPQYIKDLLTECQTEEAIVLHDVVGFLNVIERHCGPLGRFIHFGMTSSDLVDTGLAMQMKRALELIISKTKELIGVLVDRTSEFKYSPIIGRTHAQLACPTTFGLVLLTYVAEFKRHINRLNGLLPRVVIGKLSGSVGTYAYVKPEVEKEVMNQLGLGVDEISTQIVSRDRHAEMLNAIALIGCSLEKLATQVRNLSRSEVAEIAEGHTRGYKGSSSMAWKINSINSENLCGLSRLLRGYAQAAMETVNLWDQRDISNSSCERVTLPDAFGLLYYMLTKACKLIKNLRVNTEQMKIRVDDNRNQWASQRTMLNLIRDGMSRAAAHSEIQNNQTNYIGRTQDDDMLQNHLQYVDIIFQRVLGT